MQTLHVGHLISADLWAGAEVSTYHAVRALAKRPDVRVSVIVLNEGELSSRLRDLGIDLHVLPEDKLSFLELRRRLRNIIAEYDIVHSHRYKENLLAALCGRPWVCTQHGRPEPFRGLARVRASVSQRLDRLAKARSARRVIAVSSEIEAWLLDFLERSRVTRVWNGIADPAPRIGIRPWSERPLRVGVLGRLTPVKHFECALEAIARCPDVYLDVVGDGPERAYLEGRARQLEVANRVDFLGHLSDPLEHVANWRALLVTSLHEGNPMSVIEALALGTPVVCGRLPGVEEMISGGAGWRVNEPGDPASWGRVLATASRDESEGSRASDCARERFLRNFTSERCAAQLLSVYRDASAQGCA